MAGNSCLKILTRRAVPEMPFTKKICRHYKNILTTPSIQNSLLLIENQSGKTLWKSCKTNGQKELLKYFCISILSSGISLLSPNFRATVYREWVNGVFCTCNKQIEKMITNVCKSNSRDEKDELLINSVVRDAFNLA